MAPTGSGHGTSARGRLHTFAGRGSAASPRWVMMEISRVARASTAERSGSSAGACCLRKGSTSAPRRPRASTTVQKYANLVDRVKSFPTSIYLQKSASIQPRTSLSKLHVNSLTPAAASGRQARRVRGFEPGINLQNFRS